VVLHEVCLATDHAGARRASEAHRDGLAAAERGVHEQELAEKRAKDLLVEAKGQSVEIINLAQKRASEIVEEAKGDARAEGERLLTAARAEIEQEVNRAKEQLRAQVAIIVVTGAEKVLGREIDAQAHAACSTSWRTDLNWRFKFAANIELGEACRNNDNRTTLRAGRLRTGARG